MQGNFADVPKIIELSIQTVILLGGIWLGYMRVGDRLKSIHEAIERLQKNDDEHQERIERLEKFAVQQQAICQANHPSSVERISFNV